VKIRKKYLLREDKRKKEYLLHEDKENKTSNDLQICQSVIMMPNDQVDASGYLVDDAIQLMMLPS
jgi:hypothetical protein